MKKRTDAVLLDYLEKTVSPRKAPQELLWEAEIAFERLLETSTVYFLDEKGERVPDNVPSFEKGNTAQEKKWPGASPGETVYQKTMTCMADQAGRSICVSDESANGAQWWLFLLVAEEALCGAVLCLVPAAPGEEALSGARRLADAVAPRFAEAVQNRGSGEYGAFSEDTAALLSHEFKTPLTVALSSLQLLRRKLQTADVPDGTDKYLDYAELNLYKALRLAMNLVEAQYAEPGSHDGQAYVNLTALLHNMAEEAEPYARVVGARLTFEDRAGELCDVVCDPFYLERILLNLLSNALKHTPEGSEVRLVLEREDEGETLCVRVEDNGPGISKDAFGFLFQKFWHGENEQGTGLGLYLSERFAKRMGGSVTAENRPRGGACFTLRIPARARAMNAVLRNATQMYCSDSRDALLRIELSELLSKRCIS